MEALVLFEVFLFEDFHLDRPGGDLFRCDDDGAFTSQARDFCLKQGYDAAGIDCDPPRATGMLMNKDL
jgi:hypothetical protein